MPSLPAKDTKAEPPIWQQALGWKVDYMGVISSQKGQKIFPIGIDTYSRWGFVFVSGSQPELPSSGLRNNWPIDMESHTTEHLTSLQ